MFDKFGEFDSCEELNEAAAGQLAEGDKEALFALAEENGIDKEDAQDYIDGNAKTLATPLMAALGKLEAEKKEVNLGEIAEDWLSYIIIRCQESGAICDAVRRKGRSLKGCIGAILKWSFENQKKVDKDIIKAAGISAGRVTLGIPGIKRAKQIIADYYLNQEAICPDSTKEN